MTFKIKYIILSCLFLSLTSCAANNNQIEQFDNATKLQAKNLSPKQKVKFCSKFKANKNQHKKQITDILWKQANNRKNNKISYKYIQNHWFDFITAKDPSIFGTDFMQLRNITLLNIRYAVNIQCPWVNKKAS